MILLRSAMGAVFALAIAQAGMAQTYPAMPQTTPLTPIMPLPASPPPPPPPPQPARPQVIQVTLSNFTFSPDMLHLNRGLSYTLRLVNTAGGGHSFSAPEFFAAMQIAPGDAGKIENGKVEVPSHGTVDILMTPMTAGTYQIVCTHFLHKTMGMHGSALVD